MNEQSAISLESNSIVTSFYPFGIDRIEYDVTIQKPALQHGVCERVCAKVCHGK